MPVLYVLKDPRTNAIRYTGKANHAGKRLASHLRDAKRRNTPLHRWIRELAAIGLIPIIDTALEVSEAEWPVAEQAWISILRDDGHDLLNVAPGGDQPHCPREVRQANGRRSNGTNRRHTPITPKEECERLHREAAALAAFLSKLGRHVHIDH